MTTSKPLSGSLQRILKTVIHWARVRKAARARVCVWVHAAHPNKSWNINKEMDRSTKTRVRVCLFYSTDWDKCLDPLFLLVTKSETKQKSALIYLYLVFIYRDYYQEPPIFYPLRPNKISVCMYFEKSWDVVQNVTKSQLNWHNMEWMRAYDAINLCTPFTTDGIHQLYKLPTK